MKQYNIEDIANRFGINIVRNKALCPFHADHKPSMTFKNNRYRCWACNASGSAIDLVINLMHCSFKEALAWLDKNEINSNYNYSCSCTEDIKPINLSRYAYIFDNPILTDNAKRFLFDQRGLHEKVISNLRISSNHTHIAIPYFALDGKTLLSVQWRYLGNDPCIPRFTFARGSKPTIYNLPILNTLQPNDDLFVSEGSSDCWAMLSAGYKAIAIPSATLLKSCHKQYIDLLCRHPRIHIVPDNDMPGLKLYHELKQHLPHLIKHPLPSNCKDFAEYYLSGER